MNRAKPLRAMTGMACNMYFFNFNGFLNYYDLLGGQVSGIIY